MTKEELLKFRDKPGFWEKWKFIAQHGDWNSVLAAICVLANESGWDINEGRVPRDFTDEEIFRIIRILYQMQSTEKKRDVDKLFGMHKKSPCKNCVHARFENRMPLASGCLCCRCPELHPGIVGGVSREQYFDGAPCEYFKEAPEESPDA